MFWKKRPPKAKNIQLVKPYYLKYDGKEGHAQVIGRVEKKFVAIEVNNPAGKINRIMKVTKREFFSDFGDTCTGLSIKVTGFLFNS